MAASDLGSAITVPNELNGGFSGCSATGGCGFEARLTPGSVAVAVYDNSDGPMQEPLSYLDIPAPGSERVSVGGVPGVLVEINDFLQQGADVGYVLGVGVPESLQTVTVVALGKGPGIEAERAALEAVVRSARWDPPLEPLPADPPANRLSPRPSPMDSGPIAGPRSSRPASGSGR